MSEKPGCDDPERGSGTVLSLGVIAVLASVAIFLGWLSAAFDAKQRADGAADFAALAAAQVLHDPFETGDPCVVASEVVRDAELVSCTVTNDRIVVSTQAEVRLGILGGTAMTGEAEAGPR